MPSSDSYSANTGSAPIVWGLDPRQLHDRFWADQGVRVIRRGAVNSPVDDRSVYLLLEPDDLALFDIVDAAKSLPYRDKIALDLRLVESEPSGYSERVVPDDEGRLVAIKRRYHAATSSHLNVTLTRDPELALIWAHAKDRREGHHRVRLSVSLHQFRTCSASARLFRANNPDLVHKCALAIQKHWPNPGCGMPNLNEIIPGVWAHASARVDSSVRLIAPLWIGAGITLDRGDIAVGPAILDDTAKVESPPAPEVRRRLKSRLTIPTDATAKPRPPRRFSKRAFDIAFSLFALAVSAPFFPMIMLVIWIEDRRPFFFAHRRQTINGHSFTCYKFRTMCRDAERMKSQLAASNICDGPQFHVKNDPRLLRVGRLLRRFHLDELPQFFNVLAGQMHVVGPRPSPDGENQFCPAWRETRLSIKPGMTGLWQVSRTRAPNADFQEWIRYDLEYVRRQNWRLDIWILCQTVKTMLSHIRLPRSAADESASLPDAAVESKPTALAGSDEPPVVTTTGRRAAMTAAPQQVPASPESDRRTAA